MREQLENLWHRVGCVDALSPDQAIREIKEAIQQLIFLMDKALPKEENE